MIIMIEKRTCKNGTFLVIFKLCVVPDLLIRIANLDCDEFNDFDNLLFFARRRDVEKTK